MIIKNIKQLLQTSEVSVKYVSGEQMKKLPLTENAYLEIEDDKIVCFGQMTDSYYAKKIKKLSDSEIIDAENKIVMPAFCDSHTHIVYAGSREGEFVDKIKGLSYEEIAKKGGGILNSAKLVAETSEEDLYEQSLKRLNEIISLGTGAVEIKSGYGLSTESEIKMLRVIKRLKENTEATIKSTFLGAHSIPPEYRGQQYKYVDLIINEMLPEVAKEKLADYVDVFCDRGFFTVEDTDRILKAAEKYGMQPKIHANELDFSGGIQIGVANNALSVDHLECVGEAEIKTLQNSNTMPTVLPGAAFFLNMKYPPVRKMIDAGLPVALASDYNPGSSPSGNMQFVASLAAIKFKMLPEEIINASTVNSAYAMGLDDCGIIRKKAKANIIILKDIPSFAFLPYSYGSDLVEKVILNGKIICDKK